MIVEYIRYLVDGDRRAGFEAAYVQGGEALKASPHCYGYELSQCTEDAASYVLRIEWDSAEGHLRDFRSSPEFQRFFSAIKPYVSDIAEMRHYTVGPVAWRRSSPFAGHDEHVAR